MNKEGTQPGSINLGFVEDLYAAYLRNPLSVSADWQEYFGGIRNGDQAGPGGFGPSFAPASIFNPPGTLGRTQVAVEEESTNLQDRVDQLIRAYRICGHMIAQIDPLGLPRPVPPELDPAHYGFTDEDMERRFSCETMHCKGFMTLRQIIQRLRNTYCRSIGVEYMHIDELKIRRWLQERMEPMENRVEITRKEQLRILTRLTDATTFEEFIRKKFVGAKSFSLEGSESLIPLLDMAIEKAGDQGVQEVVLGNKLTRSTCRMS